MLSAIALAFAFLPELPRFGNTFQIPEASGEWLSGEFKPVLFVLALNLVVLSPLLARSIWVPKSCVPERKDWLVPWLLPIVALMVGWLLGGIRLDQTKALIWSGHSVLELSSSVFALMAHALMVAVVEESFFRGILIPLLRRVWSRALPKCARYSTIVALVVSSLLFGLAHAHLGLLWVLCAALAGVGYGLLYLRTGGLVQPVLVHGVVVLLLTAFFVI